MNTKRKPLPGVKQCHCGSRSFVNGQCAMCAPRSAVPEKNDELGWLGKEYADLYKTPAA